MGSIRYLLLSACVCPVLVLVGCSGSDDDPGVEVKTAHLYQTNPGDVPSVRMGWTDGGIPDPSLVVAWLIYRGNNYGLAAEPYNLIDVRGERSLSLYEDLPAGTGEVTFSRTFTYLNYDTQAEGRVQITYSHPPLVVGQTYYYRARRVVKPRLTRPPIATAAATDFEVDPAQALGEPSAPQGPVTYFLPPSPSAPSHHAPAVDLRSITFEWALSTGANEYQVRVYNNASATGTPIIQSGVQRPIGAYGSWTYASGGSSPVKANTTYYWVVCARRSGEAPPSCGAESGWLKSEVWQFRTAPIPPPYP